MQMHRFIVIIFHLLSCQTMNGPAIFIMISRDDLTAILSSDHPAVSRFCEYPHRSPPPWLWLRLRPSSRASSAAQTAPDRMLDSSPLDHSPPSSRSTPTPPPRRPSRISTTLRPGC